MGATIGDLCQKRLGPYDDDFCYKKAGHNGKCYRSVGLEAEDYVQEVLKLSGYKVVKGTIHEDHVYKVDFWVECNNEECPLIAGRDFVPIQFTIDREAAYGLKGRKALHNGTVIVWIAWPELVQWQNASDEDMRKVLSLKIAQEFMSAVKQIAGVISYLGLKLRRPTCLMSRFEVDPAIIHHS